MGLEPNIFDLSSFSNYNSTLCNPRYRLVWLVKLTHTKGNGAWGGCQHKSQDQKNANSVEHEVGDIDVEFEYQARLGEAGRRN